jgi:hypothetical protein
MLFVLVLALMPAIAPACTSFGICHGTNIVVGNNDDWFSFSACLVVNKRDITDAEVERLIQSETMEYVAVAGK